MTPDQITLLTALAAIIGKIGTWPIGTVILVVVIGPWIFQAIDNRFKERRAEAARIERDAQFNAILDEHKKQFEAMKQMYENNAVLVKNYEGLSNGLMDCVVLNTVKLTEVSDKISSNEFCPWNRIKKLQVKESPA